MNEDKDHIDYFQLTASYLSGNASEEEVRLLEEWVLSSPENKAQFAAFKNAWTFAGMQHHKVDVDVEREWQAVSGHLFPEAKTLPLPGSPRRSGLFLRMAAAAAVLLIASVLIFRLLKQDGYLEFTTESRVEENLLPDGTQISMNRFSSITYAPSEKKYRRLQLTGDAFFEVERDTARPFVITAQDIEIEVLGTAFYVDAREDQPQVQVIVQSGSVAMAAGTAKVTLSAGETGIYEKAAGRLTKKANDDVNYMAWKTGVLVFQGTTLEQVVFDLNRKFHARVSIADPALNRCEITVTLENKSLEAAAKIIGKTLEIKAEVNGDTVVFSGQGCD